MSDVSARKMVKEFIVPKCSSKAFEIRKGQILRVIAAEGKQVADIRFLNAHDYREQFASRFSVSLNSTQGLGGMKRIKKFYSKPPWYNVMLTVLEDKVGDHNFGCQCTPKHYELRGKPGHLSCADLFERCLRPYGLTMADLDSAGVFNAFMPVRFRDDQDGTFVFERPSCEKGDYIDLRAEMDILVAAVSCPEEDIVNDFAPKGVKYQILEEV